MRFTGSTTSTTAPLALRKHRPSFRSLPGFSLSPKKSCHRLLFSRKGRLLIHHHLGDQEDGEIQLQLDLQEMADGVFPGLEETLPEPHLVHQKEEEPRFSWMVLWK